MNEGARRGKTCGRERAKGLRPVPQPVQAGEERQQGKAMKQATDVAIRSSEVRRVRPRVYKEFARLDLRVGQSMRSSRNGEFCHLRYPLTNWPAKRSCRKDGTPVSPWLIAIGAYSYTIEEAAA